MQTPGIRASKLSAPRVSPSAIYRGPLVTRLLDSGARLVVLTAPAGFGKTTLARQWVQADDRPFAWLTVDDADDDPVVLFRHLAAALASVATMTETVSLVEASRRVDVLRGQAAIESDLATASESFVVIIDEVDALTSADSVTLLERVLRAIPVGSAAGLASRRRPPFKLGRRQLEGDFVELSGSDLAFSAAESREVLRRTTPALGEGLEASLLERCDGWPAAVGLAAIAVSNGINTETLKGALATAEPVTTYLHEEMLGHITPSDLHFLVSTSVLVRVHTGLGDALLERNDSAETLERLVESGNLFVAGYDDQGTWFRYHPLLRELLLTQLRTHGAERERVLRRRATVWLHDHEMLDDAIAQALAAGDRDEAAGLAYLDVFPLLDEGRTATLQHRLSRFTVPETLKIPELALIAAAVAGMAARPDEVTRWMKVVEAVDPQHTLSDGTNAEIGSAAVRLITGYGGAKASLGAARVILAAGPAATPWWAIARLVGVISEFSMDLLDEPIASFRDLLQDVRDSPVVSALAAAHGAVLSFQAHQDVEGRALTERAVENARRANLGDSPMMVVVSSAQALSAASVGLEAEARDFIEESNRLLADLRATNARGQIFVRLVLAETGYRLQPDDVVAAQLSRAQALLPAEPDVTRLSDWADELSERFAARRLGGQHGAGALTPAELRVLGELQSHRSLPEIAARLFVSRNTVKSQAISIYRKLGVSGRNAAVERAQMLGMLDEG